MPLMGDEVTPEPEKGASAATEGEAKGDVNVGTAAGAAWKAGTWGATATAGLGITGAKAGAAAFTTGFAMGLMTGPAKGLRAAGAGT